MAIRKYVAERRTPFSLQELTKAGDAVVAPKQAGEQGFYKVWVSDAPMVAE